MDKATSWNNLDVSNNFDNYDDILEQTLGYAFVKKWLPQNSNTSDIILDYGCGPGKVAQDIAIKNSINILAVDESEYMIKIAKEKRSHPLIAYHAIKNDKLLFVPDNSINAALLCFVLLNLSSKIQIKNILKEIYRVLKRNAPCIILDTHPESTGIKFSSFQSGANNTVYADGQLREAWLFLPNGGELELFGYHWSKDMYQDVLKESGFTSIVHASPVLKDLSTTEIQSYKNISSKEKIKSNEWIHPPYILFKGVK